MKSKIRTLNQLTDILSAEMAWRKKELIYLKTLIEKNRYNQTIDTLLRSGVTLLYAHWEGFIKNSSTAYLEFVARQNLAYKDLAPNFIALAMKGEINKASINNSSISFTEVVNFFLNGLSSKCSLSWENSITTKSNLSSAVFKEIIHTLGLDYYPVYELREKLIDKVLLHSRNNIAHGQYLEIDCDQYLKELHEKVLDTMQLFATQIINAASTQSYRAL